MPLMRESGLLHPTPAGAHELQEATVPLNLRKEIMRHGKGPTLASNDPSSCPYC